MSTNASARTRERDEPGGLVQELEVGLDLARRPRTLHLHRDAFAVRQHGSVHLPDGGRGDGLQLELEEGTLERQPELGLEHLLDLAGGERADVVLERAELEDDVRRHDVGTGRQHLAELHEGGPELVEHGAQTLATRRARAGGHLLLREPPGLQVDAAPLEQEAEAVLRRDLRNLRQASQLPYRRPRHAGQCTAGCGPDEPRPVGPVGDRPLRTQPGRHGGGRP